MLNSLIIWAFIHYKDIKNAEIKNLRAEFESDLEMALTEVSRLTEQLNLHSSDLHAASAAAEEQARLAN